jgi:hypothetical protein
MRERDLDTARRQFSPPDSGLFERLLDTPVAGARNATLAAGRFPLVLYALGLNDYQQENTVLWEFLTSHGFVVVVVPQLGASAEAFRMRFGAEAMRLQAADLMLVAARMRAAPYVAPLSPAYVGHSSGALAGFLAAQAMGASGVVSLDGDLTTPSGAALLTGDLGGRSTNFPILALHKVVPEPSVTLSFVGSLPTRNWAIGFSKATHFDFQNWALFGDLFNREDPRAGQLRDMKTGATIYRSMCRLTLAFLQEPGEPNSRLKAEIEMLQQAGSGAVTIEPGR